MNNADNKRPAYKRSRTPVLRKTPTGIQGLDELTGGEPGVFVAFEEQTEELSTNFASLGHDLKTLVAKKKLSIDFVDIERRELDETGEYDLGGLFIRLGNAISAAHFAQAGIARGERCLWFAFEESPSQIIRNMRSIGIDLAPAVQSGMLRAKVLADDRVQMAKQRRAGDGKARKAVKRTSGGS